MNIKTNGKNIYIKFSFLGQNIYEKYLKKTSYRGKY